MNDRLQNTISQSRTGLSGARLARRHSPADECARNRGLLSGSARMRQSHAVRIAGLSVAGPYTCTRSRMH